MVYGCGNQLIKFLIFISNLLIFIFGAVIFGVSLWVNLDKNFSERLTEFAHKANINEPLLNGLSQYQASLWVLVAVGALLFLVGFLGCCGAACESVLCLTLFFVIVFILWLIELATLVSMVVNRGELLQSLHQVLAKSSETLDGRQKLRPIEHALQCCGATADTAYLYAKDCEAIKVTGESDCYSVLSAHLENMGELVLMIGGILVVVQAFSMIFSCVLCKAFRERGPIYYD